jgi:hypothetical protein
MNLAEPEFPALSKAMQRTDVVPTGKTAPGAGSQVGVRTPSMASTAVGKG